MCDPVSLMAASLGLSVASAGAGFVQAQQTADATNAAYAANAEAARKAAIDSYAAQQTQRRQVEYNADMQTLDQRVEAMRARATGKVAAGEAGVAGNAIDQFIQDITAQEGRRYDALGAQFDADIANINSAGKQVSAQNQQRINSMPQAADPSPIPFVIQGAGGIVNTLRQFKFPQFSIPTSNA